MARVCARTIFSDRKLTVTAVESLEFPTGRSNHGHFFMASLKPIAIIVTEPDRTYALDLAARPVDIDRLDLPPDFGTVPGS